MITNVMRWLLHWIGQGMKLWFYAALASFFLFPLYPLLGLLEDGVDHFDDLTLFSKMCIVVGYILCYGIGLAVFTAVLASQLKDNPLRAFRSSSKDETDVNDQTKRTEQAGGGQSAARTESA